MCIQRRDGLRFPLEALAMARLQNFDGNRPPQPGVDGLVHFSHAALADGRDELVPADLHTRGRGHAALILSQASTVSGAPENYCAHQPPSIRMSVPVMNDASSEQR